MPLKDHVYNRLPAKKVHRVRLQLLRDEKAESPKQEITIEELQPLIEETEERDQFSDLVEEMPLFLSILDEETQPFSTIFDEEAQPFSTMFDEETQPLLTAVAGGQQGAQEYLALIRNLMKNSGVYALGSMASPLIALILAPFLTRHLSPTDYGAFAVLNTVITLVTAITQIGINTAFFRAYNHDYESEQDRLYVLSTSIILMTTVSIPLALIIMILSPWVATTMFNDPSLVNALRVGAVIILLQNLAAPGISWLRADKRAVVSSLLAVANPLTTLGATILLLGLLHMGITGAFLAVTAGYAVIVICILPMILIKAGFHLRFEILKNLLAFGGPIIFTSVAVWVLQVSDRVLLSYDTSLAQTAKYSVAYSLGGVLAPVIIGPFGLAWPPIMYMIAKRKDAAQVFRLVFRWFSFVVFFAAFGLSVLAILMLTLFFPPTYHSAAPLIPLITGGIMFYGLYNFVILGVYIQRRTSITAFLTIMAGLVNLGFNIVLIPSYGAMGAAVSTLVAFMILAIVAYFVNQHIYYVPFEIGVVSFGLLLGIIFYLGSSLLLHTQLLYVRFSVSVVIVIFYGGCLVLLGLFAERRHKKRYPRTRGSFVL